uniref:Uncharacterized protein n=2 Tax=viral metagenome TaxID=1070528 RepID=A0A6M3ISJ4_9ZZZZ
MPYKDKELSREAAKIRKQKERMSHPVTPDTDVTPFGENVTPYNQGMSHPDVTPDYQLYWYTTVNGTSSKVMLDSVPPGCKVLSDGQVWRPSNRGYHGGEV